MKIAIGCDHAGFELKEHVKAFLAENYNVVDKGTYSADSVDYPDFAHQVATAAGKGDVDFGILICGSANGVAMAANKHQEVRAAICWLPEIASLAKQHNNANVICLPGRFISKAEAEAIINAYMSIEFEGGRHQNRIDKIPCA